MGGYGMSTNGFLSWILSDPFGAGLYFISFFGFFWVLDKVFDKSRKYSIEIKFIYIVIWVILASYNYSHFRH